MLQPARELRDLQLELLQLLFVVLLRQLLGAVLFAVLVLVLALTLFFPGHRKHSLRPWENQPSTSGLTQSGSQGGQVARPRARVQLRPDQLFPAQAAGGGRAGQAEQEGAVGDAGEGARLQAGSADVFEAERAEQLAEAVHVLVEQRQQRLRRGIAAGEAGAAGDEDAIHALVGDPLRHLRAQGVLVVAQQRALHQRVPDGGQRRGEKVAGTVLRRRARIRHRQQAQAQGLELDLGLAHAASVSNFSSSTWCSRVSRSTSSSRSPATISGRRYSVRPSTRWSVMRPCGKL